MPPFISICIPAYKRPDFLKRLLDSIAVQTFRDFEVIMTDDSPDGSVAQLVKEYESSFHVHYHKNPTPLGSPGNWNAALSLAKGQWIKMMHDDDWFADAGSLAEFADTAKHNKNKSFIFSGFTEVQ
jgi:glycosyltransferase involved in cell wall biosynthesis